MPEFRPITEDEPTEETPSIFGDSEAPFPVDALPEPLQTLVAALALQNASSPQLPASVVLATVAAAIGKGIALFSGRGLTVFPNLYFAVGVASGVGKSVVFRRTAEILQAKFLDVCRALNESLEEGAPLAACFATDATDQAIIHVLKRNPHHCAAILSAEARPAVDNILGRYSRGRFDGNTYLAGLGGDFIASYRVTSGDVQIPHPCMTVMLCMQLDKISELYEKPECSESGLLARFLPSTAELVGKPLRHDVVGPRTAEEWEGLLEDALALYRNSGSHATVSLSSAALSACDAFELETDGIYEATQSEGLRKVIRRQNEICHKLTLVFHFCRYRRDAGNHDVHVDDWKSAARIVRWYLPQASMLLAPATAAALEKEKRRLLRVFDETKASEATLRILKQNHGIFEETVERLAAAYPSEFRIHTRKQQTGRPSRIVALIR